MDDYRLVAARRLAWNKNAGSEAALIALATQGLRELLAGEADDSVVRAEAEYLIKKLGSTMKGSVFPA